MPPRAGRVACAVVHTDPPAVLVAEDDDVLTRLLALEVVARTSPVEVESQAGLDLIRAALLDERWADAVVEWIEHTGTVIDAYPDEPVWSSDQLEPESMTLEMRMSSLFRH